jgi:hypothetical protein
MTNYGFEIELNGEILHRAGFDNQYYVLNCIISSMRRKIDESEELDFRVSGLNSDTEQHVDWMVQKLKLGDKISVQVIADNFDKPVKVRARDSKQVILEEKIKYYYKLKEELKEHLTE